MIDTLQRKTQDDIMGFLSGQPEVTSAMEMVAKPFMPFLEEVRNLLGIPVLAGGEFIASAVVRYRLNPQWLITDTQSHAFYAFVSEVLVPHKIAVFREGIKIIDRHGSLHGMYPSEYINLSGWLVLHDMSKVGGYESATWLDRHMGHKDEAALKTAVAHHYRMNPHHPEHWLVNGVQLEMPRLHVYEMVADLAAASQTYGTPLQEWIDANFDRKPLHPASRELARTVLEHVYKIKFKD